jgi:hypothetical protein
MNIRNTLIALWAGIALASAGNVKGLPPKFTFGIVPRKGTAWYLNATNARLYRDASGSPTCSYLGDLVFPAKYDRRANAYYCPAITVRHIHSIDIQRYGGKCEGMICGYDIAVPGGGSQLTTDLVAYCPDIIATVVENGRMQVVAAKDFLPHEDATPYFRNGSLIDLLFVTEPTLVDKCGGPRYRRQIDYWFGFSAQPGDIRNDFDTESDQWDGI